MSACDGIHAAVHSSSLVFCTHLSAFTIAKVIGLPFGWKRKVLVLEKHSSDFPRPGPGVAAMGAKFAPQYWGSVIRPWPPLIAPATPAPHPPPHPPAVISTPCHPHWFPASSNALLNLIRTFYLILYAPHSSTWSYWHFKKNQSLKIKGWNSESGLAGIGGQTQICTEWEGSHPHRPFRQPLPVHCLQGWPEGGGPQDKVALDPQHHGPPWALNDIWIEFITPHFIIFLLFFQLPGRWGKQRSSSSWSRRKQAKWALKTKHNCLSLLQAFFPLIILHWLGEFLLGKLMHHCLSCEPCLPLRKYFISQKPLLQIALSFTKDLGHLPGPADTFPLLISGLICLHFYF